MREIEKFKRLFGFYIIAIIGPIVLIGALTVSFLFGRLSYNTKNLNENILQYTQRSIDSVLRGVSRSAIVLSNNEDVRWLVMHSDKQRIGLETKYYSIQQELKKQLSYNAVEAVAIFLPGNGVILDNASLHSVTEYYTFYLSSTAYSLDEWETLLRDGADRPFCVPARIGTAEKPKWIIYCQPLNIADKAGGGTFLAVLNCETLLEPLKDLGLDDDKAFALLDDRNRLVMGTANFSWQVEPERLTEDGAEFRDGLDFILYRQSQQLNLKYVYVFPRSNLSSNINWLAILFVLLLLFCIGLSALLARWSSKRLQMPILRLSNENDTLTASLHRYIEREHDQILINQLLHIRGLEEPQDEATLRRRMGLTGRHIRLALVGLADLEDVELTAAYEEIWKQLIDAARAVLNGLHGGSYRMVQMSNHLVCVLSYDDEKETEGIWERLIEDCRQAELEICVGYDDRETDVAHLWNSYDNGVSALQYAIRLGPGRTAAYGEIQSGENDTVFYTSERELALIRNIKAGAKAQTEELLEQIYCANFVERYLDRSALMRLNVDMSQTVYKLIDAIFAKNAEEYDKYRRVCQNALQYFEMQDGFELLREACVSLCDYMAAQDDSGDFQQRLENFIEDNYMRSDLSLQVVADHMDMSYYYLSRRFKEVMGKTFRTYITDFRMLKAREKLEAGTTVKQVAAEIGFLDVSAFIRTYKKYYNVTPGGV